MDSGRPQDAGHRVLRILLLEDDAEDAALVERALASAGFAYTLRRVASEAGFRSEIAAAPDLIVSDYQLPGYTGLDALALARERFPQIPFILVSGRLGETLRRQALEQGAAAVLSKRQLERLPEAIRAALRMSTVRERARAARGSLPADGQEIRDAFEHAAAALALAALDGRWLRANRAFCALTGYSEEELRGRDCHAITHPEDVPGEVEALSRLVAEEIPVCQRDQRYIRKDGRPVWVQVTASLVRGNDGAPLYRVVQVLDITARRQAEARFRALFEHAAVGIAHTTPEGRILEANPKLCEMLGYAREELVGRTTRELTHPGDRDRQDALREELIAGRRAHFGGEKRYLRRDGTPVWLNRTVTLAHDASSGTPYLVQVFEDITEQKRAEAQLARANRARCVLLECSRAHVRARSETELLDGLCRAIVETGGYRQGWIGLATGDPEKPLRVAAQAGYREDRPYLPAAGTDRRSYRGVALTALASGEIAVARDLLNDPRPEAEWARERARRHGFQSSIALPLAAQGKRLGVLVVHAPEPDAFDEQEVALLATLAGDIALGILAARSEEERRRAQARLARLTRAHRMMAECNHALVRARDEAELLQEMCRIAVEAGGFRQAWIALATGDAARPVYPAAYAGFPEGDAPMTSPASWTADGRYQGSMGEVVASGEVLIVRDVLNDPRHARKRERALALGWQSQAMLPLVGEGKIYGGVGLFAAEPDAFDEEEVALLRGLADDIAFGITAIRTRIARERAEGALLESERRFREIFDQAAVGITRVDLDGVLLEVNQKFCDMLGYTRAELIGRHIRDITHPEDFGQGERFRVRIASGSVRSQSGEKRFVRKDGEIVWARRTMSAARDAEGRIRYVISVVEDINEQKRAALELERKNALTRLLEALARAANEAASPEAAMRASLERICEHGGWKLARLGLYGAGAGDRLPERSLWHTAEPSRFEAFMRASLDPRHFLVSGRFVSLVLKEKRPVWLADIAPLGGSSRLQLALECGLRSAFAFPVIVGGEVAAFLEFFAEEPREPDALLLEAVTSVGAQLARLIERARATAAAAQLAAIVESSPDAVISVAPDGTILTWNPGAERLLGYSAAEALGADVGMLVPEERREEAAAIREAALSGRQVAALDTERLAKGGRRIAVSVSAAPLRAEGGVSGFALIYRDITERKRAEDALARERALLRAVVDNSPDHIYVKDREGRYLLVNAAGLRIRGLASESEILGKTVYDVLPRPLAERLDAEDRAVMESGEPLINREASVRFAPGSDGERWHLTTKVPMRDEAGRIVGLVGVNHDITERVVSERRRAMEHAVTRVLAESASVQEAMPRVLRTIAEAMGWAYGARWGWSDEHKTLVRIEHWSDEPFDLAGPGEEAWLKVRTLEPGGLLRRAWIEKASTWIEDIEREPSLGRRAKALELGLRSAYAFPILDGSEVVGAIEFFGREPRRPDPALVEITASIARQVGQFLRHRRAEAERARLAAIVESSHDAIISRTPDGRILSWNAGAERMFGYRADEMIGAHVSILAPPERRGEAIRNTEILSRGGEVEPFETVRLTRDGRRLDVLVSVSAVRDAEGRLVAVSAIFRDITERKRAEDALREAEEQFRQLANNIPQVFWISDVEQKHTIYISPAVERLIGRSAEELRRHPRLLVRAVHAEDRARVLAARKAAIAGGYDESYRIVRPDGSVRWVHDRAFPVRDASGRVYRIAGIAEDITERKLAEERLLHLAHYDVLTSLPNRVLFYDRLKQALAQAKRNQWVTGVMFLDVDRFKNVNDTLGHAVGDRLLQQVSERLLGAVRSGDTVGRLGGDEFAIVLSNLSSAQDANMVAQKIMSVFAKPFDLEGAEIYVTVSIGITLYPYDSTDQDTLIRNADAAMYRAKETGRSCYQFYRPEMNARALELLGLESSLRRALERGEFLLYYQPKANVSDGSIVGVEALIRWRHPERGMVAPSEFIPVLEETGLIVRVGEWVLEAVCEQINAWKSQGIAPPPVAVNLSARQFSARDFGARVRRILNEHGVEPRLLELEITESSIMANAEEAARTLEELAALGVGLSIDDFGTGYSSLGYLKRFPLDGLKIDRSFVRDITHDGDDATITRAVISMAHSLGLKVIAEGVETEEQLAFLAEYGCDQVQGYYFARPLAPEECGQWLREGRRMRRPYAGTETGAPTLLLVDDDEDALALLKRTLARDGYRILLARNAAEAFAVLDSHRVDVVISDHKMPGMSGTDFLQRVKVSHPRAIRMMTSGYDDFRMVAEAVNKGEVARFLPKSLSEEELRASVSEALRARSPSPSAA